MILPSHNEGRGRGERKRKTNRLPRTYLFSALMWNLKQRCDAGLQNKLGTKEMQCSDSEAALCTCITKHFSMAFFTGIYSSKSLIKAGKSPDFAFSLSGLFSVRELAVPGFEPIVSQKLAKRAIKGPVSYKIHLTSAF